MFSEGAYADKALFNILKFSGLEERDRAFLKELSFGTIRRRKRLDFLISKRLKRKINELDPDVLNILRLGVYQICYLRVPDYASVNEMVAITKVLKGGGAEKLVNAVLRRVSREGCEPERFDDPIEELSVVESHPKWLVELWESRFGLELTRDICRHDNEAQPVTIRVNDLKKSPQELISELAGEGVDSSQGGLSESLSISSGLDLSTTGSYGRGEFIIQSEASMLVADAFSEFGGKDFIDLCSAPGGKTTHLAQMLHGEGKVISVELNPARAEIVKRNIKRMSFKNIKLVIGDATKVELEAADGVLLDAPCTGLGVLGRRPELRWRVKPEDIAKMAEIQRRLLERAAEMVRPGGLLVYSTCTISAAENEDQITSFLERHSEFELEKLPAVFERFPVDLEQGYIQLIPPRDKMDGFFVARMHKKAL